MARARSPEGRSAGQTVGLLCGGGELPWPAADALHRKGCRVVAIGIKGEADPAIEEHADEVHWTGIAKLGGWIRIFRAGARGRAADGRLHPQAPHVRQQAGHGAGLAHR